MNYRTFTDLNQAILKGLPKVPRDIDLIVGIPRSGMMPANLLALYLNKPYTDIHSFINGHIYTAGERAQFFEAKGHRKILVVDDSVASGGALKKSKQLLTGSSKEYEYLFCAVYVAPGKEQTVDISFETVPLPRYFQWNIFNHTDLEKSCFDIDGVLCVDPTPEQNDDGPRYLDFIINAPPLFIPGSRIGALVTSRLEKYRPETEAWLAQQGIKYNKLIMLDLPDKEARMRANNHATFKAETYRSGIYKLFIESSLSQAHDINRLTGKPVFCTETFEMIFNAESLLYNIKSGKYVPFLRRGALRVRDMLKRLRSSLRR